MVMPNADNVKGWWGAIYPILAQSTPITMAFTLLFAVLMAWYLLGEVRRTHDVNLTLYQNYLAMQEKHLALALKCGQHQQP